LEQLGSFPDEVNTGTQVMLANFGGQEEHFCLKIVSGLRNSGIRAELYPDNVKLNKQMIYANAKKIPYVILIGEQELASGKCTVKNMMNGEQDTIEVNHIIEALKLV
jgi:histidyl-tRNA synthetase